VHIFKHTQHQKSQRLYVIVNCKYIEPYRCVWVERARREGKLGNEDEVWASCKSAGDPVVIVIVIVKVVWAGKRGGGIIAKLMATACEAATAHPR
jgi:hypothetical protein